jgi:hypothetical protein
MTFRYCAERLYRLQDLHTPEVLLYDHLARYNRLQTLCSVAHLPPQHGRQPRVELRGLLGRRCMRAQPAFQHARQRRHLRDRDAPRQRGRAA